MPDGSAECGRILAKIDAFERALEKHEREEQIEIAEIKDMIEEIRLSRAKEAGALDGIQWALARVGAGVMLVLMGVGWLTTGGGWAWLKKTLQ